MLKYFPYFEPSLHSVLSSLFAYFLYHMYCMFFNCSRMFFSVNGTCRLLLIHYSVKMWYFRHLFCVNFSVFSPFPHPFLCCLLVSINPPDADPQLCGVPVLLPTWAERLFPPGPPPGTNERAVPGRGRPLPRNQPQQQVGGRTAAWNNDHESSRTVCTSWFQKYELHFWLTVLACNVAGPLL